VTSFVNDKYRDATAESIL